MLIGAKEVHALTVRDKSGRHRYIGFTVETQARLNREDISRALSETARLLGAGKPVPSGELRFQLTVFDGRRGIVKVPHYQKDAAIAALVAIRKAGRDGSAVDVRTVVTSGTICTVKARMGIPEGPKPWERKRQGRTGSRQAGGPESRRRQAGEPGAR